MADIVAWRVIYWFYCGKLDQIDNKFLDKNEKKLLKNYFNKDLKLIGKDEEYKKYKHKWLRRVDEYYKGRSETTR